MIFAMNLKQQIIIGKKKRIRAMTLTMGEIMTISIWYHYSSYKTFKDYYTKLVQTYLRNEFPKLVSYNRFIGFIIILSISYKQNFSKD